MNASLLNLSEEAYHADPCKGPSLSSSIAKILVDKSAAHAHAAHPKLGGGVRERGGRETLEVLDRGALIHKLLLGKGAEVVAVEASDWRTKAAREKRDEARARGHIPVLTEDLADAVQTAEGIRERLAVLGIVLTGASEVTITWQEETRYGPIWCRARPDHLIEAEGVIYDLKTSRSAHPRACVRHVIDYGYDIQRAAYTRGLTRLRPELAGREDFVFLFVETERPYAVTPARLDAQLREYGSRRWAQAVATWGRCLHTGEWPGYVTEAVYLEAPPWLLASMEG